MVMENSWGVWEMMNGPNYLWWRGWYRRVTKLRLGKVNTVKIGKTLDIIIKLFHSMGKTCNFNVYVFLYKIRIGRSVRTHKYRKWHFRVKLHGIFIVWYHSHTLVYICVYTYVASLRKNCMKRCFQTILIMALSR